MIWNWTWDWNDWYLVISMAIGLLLYWRLPKPFSNLTVVLITLFTAFEAQTIDEILAGVFDVYDYLDVPALEPAYAVAQFVLYPLFAYFYLYTYTKWAHTWRVRVGLVLGWTALSVGYEWLTVLNGALTYKGWHLYYSVPVYVVEFIVLVCYYRFLQKLRVQA